MEFVEIPEGGGGGGGTIVWEEGSIKSDAHKKMFFAPGIFYSTPNF